MTTAAPPRAIRIGPEGMPAHSVGWDAIEWACTHLLQPDGPHAREPWVFTDEQMRFLVWWYAVDDRGDWLYTRGVLRRMKGWGKDPLAAVMAAIEFIGPCRFGGWKADGEAIGIPQPAAWVDVAAVAREQTRNTVSLFASLFSKDTISEYGIDLGKELIYGPHGAKIQAVTSSPKTLEGHRSTFCIENETQHWLDNNDGTEMDKAIRRNVAKVNGRALAITNAHRVGEGSVAEADWIEYLEQGTHGHLLYDSLEAPEDTDIEDDDSLRSGLMAARGDSFWVPIDRLMIDARDKRDSESYRRRYYLNQIRSERNSWILDEEWKEAERVEEVPVGTWITLGFDGSRTRDATALVGTVVETGYQWVLGAWTRPSHVDQWEVPQDDVNRAVADAFETYRVARMNADPYWWDETIAHWQARYGRDVVQVFRTNALHQRVGLAVKSYETAVRMKEMGHGDDPLFAEHIANCVKYEIGAKDEDHEPLYRVEKENNNSPHKIDIAMAALLSWDARTQAIAEGVGMSYGWIVG